MQRLNSVAAGEDWEWRMTASRETSIVTNFKSTSEALFEANLNSAENARMLFLNFDVCV
jgi:hypothetical protein